MKLAKQIIIYGVSGAASRLAAILLVPLYTRTLNVADYGQLEVLLAMHSLFVLIAGLQSESAAARDFHEASLAQTSRKLVWGTIVMTVAGSGVLIALMLFTAALDWLPTGTMSYLPLLFAMTVPTQLLGIQLVLLRFASAPIFFASLAFLDLALSALISTVLIVGFKMGIVGGLYGILGSKCLCVALAWPRTFGSAIGARPDRPLLNRMFSYALPTMPSVLLNWLQTNGSRVLLAIFLTLGDVALVGIAIKVSALYGFLTYSFRLAWEPYSFEKLSSHTEESTFYGRAFQWYVVAMFLACGSATIASPLIVAILAPPAYAAAIPLAGFFIVGQFWVGAISILAIGIHGARITSRLTLVYGIGAVSNVALLVGLSGHLGVAAAAIGFMVSAVISALLATHYSELHFRAGFERRLIAWSVIATMGFATVAYLATSIFALQPWTSLAITTCGFVAAGVMIAGLGFRSYRIADMWGDLVASVSTRVPR